MEKVKTMQEAYRVFELLGIKEVTKPFQKRKGTEVWELPQKTMYYNGHSEVNRFTIYRNGYIRKMIVNGETNGSKGCWQLNLVRKVPNYIKDYDYNDDINEFTWTGKYRKIYNRERIMIDNHRDRVIYLCNYILKNYYRSNKYNLVDGYTMKRVAKTHREWWRSKRNQDDLPFFDGDEHDLVASLQDKKEHDVQVIIDGHRYNLS
jgi:hypothetical protein